jgi:hypothetical protein
MTNKLTEEYEDKYQKKTILEILYASVEKTVVRRQPQTYRRGTK